jgi:hypothetical protein
MFVAFLLHDVQIKSAIAAGIRRGFIKITIRRRGWQRSPRGFGSLINRFKSFSAFTIKMKRKTLARIAGATAAVVWGYFGYRDYGTISSIDYGLLPEFFRGNYPVANKIIEGLKLAGNAASVPLIAAGMADGLVDLIKGTHHDVGMKIYRKFALSAQTKAQIDKDMAQMYELREKPVSYKLSK